MTAIEVVRWLVTGFAAGLGWGLAQRILSK